MTAERERFLTRKMEEVLRVLREEDLDLVFSDARITAAKVSEWRDQLVTNGTRP